MSGKKNAVAGKMPKENEWWACNEIKDLKFSERTHVALIKNFLLSIMELMPS